MGTVLDQATLRKVAADQAETISKASDPVKFKDNQTWPKWEVKVENYLSRIPGVNGVPLSYIVQSQAAPDHTTYFQGEFISKTIVCAELSRAHFQSDTRKVRHLLNNYLVDETA